MTPAPWLVYIVWSELWLGDYMRWLRFDKTAGVRASQIKIVVCLCIARMGDKSLCYVSVFAR